MLLLLSVMGITSYFPCTVLLAVSYQVFITFIEDNTEIGKWGVGRDEG